MTKMPRVVRNMRRRRTRAGRSLYPTLSAACATYLHGLWTGGSSVGEASGFASRDERVVEAWFRGFEVEGKRGGDSLKKLVVDTSVSGVVKQI